MRLNRVGGAAGRTAAVVLVSAGGLAACSSTTATNNPIAQTRSVSRTTIAVGSGAVVRTGAAARKEEVTTTARALAGRRAKPAAYLPLAGKVVGVDPGHNGLNGTDPAYIDHQIWNGREWENCNTTGTETDGGYTEARYNWNVATYLTADLKALGAKVVLTRHSNDGVGPCVNKRAEIMDRAHVDVAIAIHADSFLPSGRGFAILEPVADRINGKVIGSSERFGRMLRARYLAITGMPISNYDGVDGIQPRFNLAGPNLTTVPYALIECGNMRNATDAALLVTASFQQRAAKAMAQAITEFLTDRT